MRLTTTNLLTKRNEEHTIEHRVGNRGSLSKMPAELLKERIGRTRGLIGVQHADRCYQSFPDERDGVFFVYPFVSGAIHSVAPGAYRWTGVEPAFVAFLGGPRHPSPPPVCSFYHRQRSIPARCTRMSCVDGFG